MSHEIESTIEIGNGRVLIIRTAKSLSGYLCTRAKVGKREGSFISHMMYQDYSEVLNQSKHRRVTAKVVQAQHDSINIEEVKRKVDEYYLEFDNT